MSRKIAHACPEPDLHSRKKRRTKFMIQSGFIVLTLLAKPFSTIKNKTHILNDCIFPLKQCKDSTVNPLRGEKIQESFMQFFLSHTSSLGYNLRSTD